MQYWKKFDDSGSETVWQGQSTSSRNRIRFFNKAAEELEFYPQLALATDGLNEAGQNPDWRSIVRDQPETDHLNFWCYSAFEDPEGETPYLLPNAETETRNDPTGIAVGRQVIDINQKKVSVSFYRPMQATSENDADFEDDTEYGVYINWGIFDSHADQQMDNLYGMK